MGSEYEPELIALGRAVRQIREQHGMSRSELAGALGVERWWVEELEAGRRDLPFDVLHAVAAGQGVTGTKLLLHVEELERVICSEEGRVQL